MKIDSQIVSAPAPEAVTSQLSHIGGQEVSDNFAGISQGQSMEILSNAGHEAVNSNLSARELIVFLTDTFRRVFSERANVSTASSVGDLESVCCESKSGKQANEAKTNDSELAQEKASKPFRDFVRDLLDPDINSSISEEKLQYGIISYQLYQKSPAIQEEYRSLFEAARDDGQRIKDAAKSALLKLEQGGSIANWEVDWVFSLSHRAAQLDSSFGGINNRSSEDISFEDVLMRAELGLVGIQSGSIEVAERGPLQVGWGVELQIESSKQEEEEKERQQNQATK